MAIPAARVEPRGSAAASDWTPPPPIDWNALTDEDEEPTFRRHVPTGYSLAALWLMTVVLLLRGRKRLSEEGAKR